MSLFPSHPVDALYLSRDDVNEPLSAFSRFGFELDGAFWPSVEHYYQAMKFDNPAYREKVRQAEHPRSARHLGRARLRRVRKDWRNIKDVIMTRALYTRARTHADVSAALLDTGEKVIIEKSLYDYYWGCGRDGRGHNKYGKVLMNVRAKLREEASEAAPPEG